MKQLIEGKDYSVHTYITKNLKKREDLPICSTCRDCKRKSLCSNRRNLYTMNKCKKCRDCRNAEECDKFYIYEVYKANLLGLGYDVNTGKVIRKQFSGRTKEESVNKLCKYKKKIDENGMPEKILKSNEKSIYALGNEIEKKRLDKGDIRANTYITNLRTLDRINTYKFASIPIQNVTKKQIENFLEDERDKSNSTIKKDYGMLKRIFEFAYLKGYIKENYFEGLEKIEKSKSVKKDKDVTALTIEEQNILEKYMDKHYSKYNNIILLALHTGMRIGEILALTLADIENNEKIVVNKTLTRNMNGKTTVGDTKTKNGNRIIMLREKTKKIINNAIKEMKPNKKNILFLRDDNQYYTDGNINGAFKRICKDAGIRVINIKKKKQNGTIVNLKSSSVSTHMIRHSFVTRCIEAGIDATVIKNLVGHRDISTTINIYGDIFNYYKQQELDKYDKYLEEAKSKFEKADER